MTQNAPSDGPVDEPGCFEQTVPVAPGLSVTVKITGNEDAVAGGEQMTQVVADLFTDSPANTLPEAVYNFSGTVTCPLSFSVGGTTYELTATFTPSGDPSDSGDTEHDVEHLLSHGLTSTYPALISMLFCVDELGGQDMLTALSQALSSMSGSGMVVIGGLPGALGAGPVGGFGGRFSYLDLGDLDDQQPPYGYPGRFG